MSNELWRTTLSTLRSRFESGAQQYTGVRCVLIHAGPGQRDRLAETPREAPEGRFVNGGFAAYEQADTPERCTWRREYYIGEPAGVYLFWRSANDAGRALLGQSPPAGQRFPRETLSVRTDRTRWLWTLFELGWQRRPGSPLKTTKLIWDRKRTGCTTFPYDTAQLRAISEMFGHSHEPFHKWAQELPDYFCSELSDVFMASVYGIDILLCGLNGRRRGKGAGKPGTTREELRKRAEQVVRRHGYHGLRPLARSLKCSPSSVSNAIKDSTFLKARKAEHEAERTGKPRETALTGVTVDDTAQQTEVDPQRQAVLNELIAEQESDVRADQRRACQRARSR